MSSRMAQATNQPQTTEEGEPGIRLDTPHFVSINQPIQWLAAITQTQITDVRKGPKVKHAQTFSNSVILTKMGIRTQTNAHGTELNDFSKPNVTHLENET